MQGLTTKPVQRHSTLSRGGAIDLAGQKYKLGHVTCSTGAFSSRIGTVGTVQMSAFHHVTIDNLKQRHFHGIVLLVTAP